MTFLLRLLPLSLALLLTACAMQEEEVMAPVEAEPILERGPEDPSCEPGTDDGIGGTGCSVD